MNVATILMRKGRDVTKAAVSDPLGDIVRRLAENKIGAIVVCDQSGGVVGIISERDIVRELANGGAGVLADPVGDHMTRNVRTCAESDTVVECMEMMTDGRFRHLPVVESGRLVGIVSIGDIVKERIAEAVGEAEAMRSYITAG